MKELLDGRLAPITHEMGFLECDCALLVKRYLEWSIPLHAERGISFTQTPVHGGLEQVLRRLLPLTNVLRRRYLFIPTSSLWTAYLDNGHQSSDAFPPMSYFAKLIGCRGLRVTYVPNGLPKRHAARILEIYGPHETDWLNTIRSIAVIADGKKWEFATGGTPQPFERVERYKKWKLSDRFTAEMLAEYLSSLGCVSSKKTFIAPTAQS